MAQMSMETKSIVDRLKSSGLWRTKGLIGGKWIDAYGRKTIEVLNFSTSSLPKITPIHIIYELLTEITI